MILAYGLFAGVVAIAITWLIERLGSRGGVLGTIPTTIVPAALGFWAADQGTDAFRQAMWAAPPGMLLNALFLLMWRELPPRLPIQGARQRLAVMVLVTLAAWFAAALALVSLLAQFRASDSALAWFAFGATAAMALLGTGATWQRRQVFVAQGRVPWPALLARGVLAALAVGGAIAWAAHLGPLMAGVLAIFPAIFLTAMVALWWQHGEVLPTGAAGPMMLGSTSVAAFALVAAWSVPRLGPGWGVSVAWVAAVLSVTLPARQYVAWRSP